jgi:hypothetical protein
MKHITPLILVLASSIAFADDNRLQKVCTQTQPEEKIVALLYRPDDSENQFLAQLCTLADFSEEGETCKFPHGGSYSTWEEITDLNNDGHLDLIIAYQPAIWQPSRSYFVLLNCGNDTYIRVLYDSYYSLQVRKPRNKIKWPTLYGKTFSLRSEFINSHSGIHSNYVTSYNKRDVFLEFDSKNFEYIAVKKGKIMRAEMSDDIFPRPDVIIYKQYNINWNQFPQHLRQQKGKE